MQTVIYRFFKNTETNKYFFEIIATQINTDDIAQACADAISLKYPIDEVYVYEPTTKEVLHKYVNGAQIF